MEQVIHEPTGYPAGRQVIHDPTGYAEGMRVIKEEETSEDKESEESEEIQRRERMPYGSRAVSLMGGEKRRSQEAIMYDAEEHWHLGLASGEWPIGEIGERVRITPLYVCKREGRLRQLELEPEAGVAGNGEESV